jgi:glycosyltransferase involved in cell wall biosynthesis
VKQNKKVLIITYYWPPSGGAGVQRWLKFAKYLPEFGVEPIILTVDPKYASYPQTDLSLENDISSDLKVFKTKSFEPLNILSVLFGKKNVPYGGFSNVNKKTFLQTILRFIRGNFFIPDARKGWNKYAYKKAKEIIAEYNIDTVITTSPPHSLQLIGLKLKRKLEIKWICDFNDPWTDIYYYKDFLHTEIAKAIDLKYEKQVLENTDHIIVNCDSNRELFLSKTKKLNQTDFNIIPNGFDPEDFSKNSLKVSNDFIITYTGTIADDYNADVFFKSIAHIISENKDINIILKFVGSFSKGNHELLKKYNLNTHTVIESYVPHYKSIEYLKESTVLLNIFPDTEYANGVPGKLCEYVAARKPIISISPVQGDSAEILKKTISGKAFSRDMDKELISYLDLLLKEWKESRNLNLSYNEEIEKLSRKYGAGVIAELID